MSYPNKEQWDLETEDYGWSSLSSPLVQVQALAHSSPRLRHAFVQNVPSFTPIPRYQSGMSSQGDEHCDTARADTRQKLPPSQHYLTSSARWCLARISWGSQLSWLSLYFTFNLLLTLSNKSVLTSFPFPYTLTAVHALCSTIGGLVMRSKGLYTVKQLDLRGELVLVAFSFLYSVNVAVSNVSLHQVTVPVGGLLSIAPSWILKAVHIASPNHTCNHPTVHHWHFRCSLRYTGQQRSFACPASSDIWCRLGVGRPVVSC